MNSKWVIYETYRFLNNDPVHSETQNIDISKEISQTVHWVVNRTYKVHSNYSSNYGICNLKVFDCNDCIYSFMFSFYIIFIDRIVYTIWLEIGHCDLTFDYLICLCFFDLFYKRWTKYTTYIPSSMTLSTTRARFNSLAFFLIQNIATWLSCKSDCEMLLSVSGLADPNL